MGVLLIFLNYYETVFQLRYQKCLDAESQKEQKQNKIALQTSSVAPIPFQVYVVIGQFISSLDVCRTFCHILQQMSMGLTLPSCYVTYHVQAIFFTSFEDLHFSFYMPLNLFMMLGNQITYFRLYFDFADFT